MKLEELNKKIPADVYAQIPSVIEAFKINTPLRLAHFLAQCAHESGNFKSTVENLNYSAKSLRSVFGKYFPDDTTAKLYERKAEKIANIVYSSRMGNGDKASGDGWKYRGRGYIQLTGKTNYAAFDKEVPEDIISNPELVATKYPLLSAAWFWNSRNLNALADNGDSDIDITNITKKINGGVHGLQDRISKFRLFNTTLS